MFIRMLSSKSLPNKEKDNSIGEAKIKWKELIARQRVEEIMVLRTLIQGNTEY